MDFYLDPSVLMILIVFGFVAAFIDSVVGGGLIASTSFIIYRIESSKCSSHE